MSVVVGESSPPPPPSSWSDDEPPHNKAYIGSHVALAVVYVVLSAVSLAALVKRCTRKLSGTKKNTWQIWFHCLFVLGCWTRASFFAYLCWEDRFFPSALAVFLNYVPSYMYFSCYFIVIICWAEVYHAKLSSSGSADRTYAALQVTLIVANAVIYSFLVALFTCFTILFAIDRPQSSSDMWSGSMPPPSDMASSDEQWQQRLQLALISGTIALYYLLAGGFALYGGLILHKIISQHTRSYLRTCSVLHDVLPRVIAITLLCTCCFICRGTIMWVCIDTPVSQSLWWFDLVYFTGLEVVPLAMMLVLLRVQNTRNKDQPLIGKDKSIQNVFNTR
ncbi:hypothetical protein Pelo_17272 [Pelomyxa schiedti]|nr:hypothetical protein Pelo_17272 [Pelomyxa schiedti]